MSPHHTDEQVTLWHGDSLQVLAADALGYPHELGYFALPPAAEDGGAAWPA